MSRLLDQKRLRLRAAAPGANLRAISDHRVVVDIDLENADGLYASFDCRVLWFESRGKRSFTFFETTDGLLVGIDLAEASKIEWSPAGVDASIATRLARDRLALRFRDRAALQRSLLTTRDIDRRHCQVADRAIANSRWSAIARAISATSRHVANAWRRAVRWSSALKRWSRSWKWLWISGPMGPTEHLAVAVNPFTGGASGLRYGRATSALGRFFMDRLSPWHFYALISTLTAAYQLFHLVAGR